MIEAHAEFEAGVAGLDVVLNIGGLLLDGRLLRVERGASHRASDRKGTRSGLKSGLSGSVEVRIGEAEGEIFVQLGRADCAAELEVVSAGRMGHIGLERRFVSFRSCDTLPRLSAKGSGLGVYIR